MEVESPNPEKDGGGITKPRKRWRWDHQSQRKMEVESPKPEKDGYDNQTSELQTWFFCSGGAGIGAFMCLGFPLLQLTVSNGAARRLQKATRAYVQLRPALRAPRNVTPGSRVAGSLRLITVQL